MKITVFGSGYVGLVTAACFARMGNKVLCVDIDAAKVAALQAGRVPIREQGLDDLVAETIASGHLSFTTDAARGVAHGLYQFIAVGTPADEDGSADLSHVLAVAATIASHMTDYRIIVDKSTVPVGTAQRVSAVIRDGLAQRGVSVPFAVVSNPEFLKEGNAVEDFMKPDRIIVGAEDERAIREMQRLYAPFNRKSDRLLVMDPLSAELTKYAANAMLATKISLMNEFANIAERVGADIEQVRLGLGSDPRIGFHFIYPGAGYGGSCFPKDVSALIHTAREVGHPARILDAVQAVNERQKSRLFERIQQHFGHDLSGLTFALWGLAFKPGTDDMREAPSRVLMEALWRAGARVRAHDPAAMAEARRLYPDTEALTLCDDPLSCLDGAEGLVVMTEWNVYRSPDFDELKQRLRRPVIFDGRNLYDPRMLAEQGFGYYAIGRPVIEPAPSASS
ncbi:MAG TPA: UDP-glucose/GDP-mannose dehydrogenase family protein [Candidatus Acidoferrales bacterium]|nr:UDP-glucose/GDP-mannose dehydrogenase family protein [Candidatus Acidoferrales bacterium]